MEELINNIKNYYKQKEIAELIGMGKELNEITYALRPVATRFKSYRVFESKYRRKRQF
jgi:hypothetical protein